jgi:hypothetical protein
LEKFVGIHILNLAGLAALVATPLAAAEKPVVIPSTFEADRVFVNLTTATGSPLQLFTDTGGGALILSPATAGPSENSAIRAELGPNAKVADAPALTADYPPLPHVALVAPLPFSKGDGFVGAPWFAGGVWTWDYPGHRLVRQRDRSTVQAGAHVVSLRFKTDADGKRPFSFPRMTVRIDGRVLPVLLDTGATTMLNPAALVRIGDRGPAERATSMIVASLFDQWHKEHPDWPFIEDGQAGSHSAMIEVPVVEIAGYAVGPIWFTRRPDANFHDWISTMMDSRIEGAIGGNALRYFEMTLDYPSARAAFRCKSSCKRVLGDSR